MEKDNVHPIKLHLALLPIGILIALLTINILFISKDDGLYGSNQLILLFAALVAAFIAWKNGFSGNHIFKSVFKSIKTASKSMLILLIIGALSGTWMLSGVVPTLIYYGLKTLNPTIFFVAACIVCSIVSIATGSSWSTVATIGKALIGIGNTLGLSPAMTAGAIISGAYFGDKMSPLSDTTNLAPAMAGTDLITHIRYMLWTTIPSILITLIIFLIIGLSVETTGEISNIDTVLHSLENNFNITPWLLMVPLAVIALIIFKVPALPALSVGTLLGGVFAYFFQYDLVLQLTSDNSTLEAIWVIVKCMFVDTSITTELELLNSLLSTDGMYGMRYTVFLIICAMAFGGAMEAGGLLKRISSAIITLVNSTGSLFASTVGTCLFFNITASDQYIAIVVPGRMFAKIYKERGLKPQNLSRTLEDSGTVTSALIPWNTCGAYHSGVLGVLTYAYFPFCFFNIISPFMTLVYGYFGIKIAKEEVKTPVNHIDENKLANNS